MRFTHPLFFIIAGRSTTVDTFSLPNGLESLSLLYMSIVEYTSVELGVATWTFCRYSCVDINLYKQSPSVIDTVKPALKTTFLFGCVPTLGRWANSACTIDFDLCKLGSHYRQVSLYHKHFTQYTFTKEQLKYACTSSCYIVMAAHNVPKTLF